MVVEIGPIAPAETLAEKFHKDIEVIDITDTKPRPVIGSNVQKTELPFTPPGQGRMSDIVTIKRGASLVLPLNFANADGSAYALAGVALEAQLRDAEENLVATLTPAQTATVGQAQIFVQDTSAWPVGLLRLDVLVQPAGGPQSISDTIGIEVLRSETQLLPEPAPYDPVTS